MKLKYIFIFLVFVYAGWNLYYLDKYPLIDMDDTWMTEPSWQFAKHGNFSCPMFEGIYGLGKSDIYHGRLFSMSQVPFLLIFNLGPFQARVATLVYAFLALILTYFIAKKLFNKEVGLLSAILLGISGLFILCGHRARQDMMLVVFILLAVYLYLMAKEKNSKVLFLLSGLIAGSSIDVHMNGIILYVLIPLLFILDEKYYAEKGSRKNILLISLGILIGFLWWAFTHVIPDLKLFFAQWQGIVMGDFRTPILETKNPFLLLRKELTRYVLWYWNATYHRNIIELLLILPVVIAIVFKKFKETKMLLVIVGTVFTVSMMFIAQKAPYYLVFLYPFLMMLFSYGVLNMNKYFGKTVLACLILFYLAQIGYVSLKYKDVNYWKYAGKVSNYIPANTTVFSDSILWFALNNNNFYADFSYGYYLKINENTNPGDYIKEKQIGYVIFGEKYINQYLNYEFKEPEFRLVGTVEDGYFGSGGILSGSGSYKTLIFKVNQIS